MITLNCPTDLFPRKIDYSQGILLFSILRHLHVGQCFDIEADVERFRRNDFCGSADVPSRNCMAIV